MNDPYCFETLACRLLIHFTAHGDFSEAAMRSALTAVGVEDMQRLAKRVNEAPVGEVSAGYSGPSVVFPVDDANDCALTALVGQRVRLLVSDDRPSHTAGDGNG